jgi:hypothetical protein
MTQRKVVEEEPTNANDIEFQLKLCGW